MWFGMSGGIEDRNDSNVFSASERNLFKASTIILHD